MSFVLLPVGASEPVQSLSTPYHVSVVAQDSGSGGTMNINCLGVSDPTVGGAVDLPSYFGAAWRSKVVAAAFRGLASADANVAAAQLLPALLVTFVPVVSTAANLPGLGFLAVAVAGVNVPFLQVAGPGAAGTFRIDIQYRHSIM